MILVELMERSNALNLAWQTTVRTHICCGCAFLLSPLVDFQQCPYQKKKGLTMVVHVLVNSKIDYWNTLCGAAIEVSTETSAGQNVATKLITGTSRCEQIPSLGIFFLD